MRWCFWCLPVVYGNLLDSKINAFWIIGGSELFIIMASIENKVFFSNLLAGGISGIISKTAIAPIDRVYSFSLIIVLITK